MEKKKSASDCAETFKIQQFCHIQEKEKGLAEDEI